jgi:Protein of unknown function (DUF2849)
MPDVITANRLADGVVVFQTADAGWSEDFNRVALLLDAEAAKAALARANEDATRNLVVDPYAFAVEVRNGHVVPKALREAIRASGPTVRRDLGKQAQGLAPHSGPTAALEADHVSL